MWVYQEPSGRVPFSDWLANIPEDAHAFIVSRLLKMEGMTKWPEKWASDYKGYKGIIELKIPHKNVQYRPLGMYGKHERRSFVLLAGAIEKGDKIPRRDLDKAANRRDRISKEPHHAKRYQY